MHRQVHNDNPYRKCRKEPARPHGGHHMKISRMSIALSVVAGSILMGYPCVNLGDDTGSVRETPGPSSRDSTPPHLDKATAERIITRHRWRMRAEHRCLELKVLRPDLMADDECAIARPFGAEVLNTIRLDGNSRTTISSPKLVVARYPSTNG